MGLLTRLCAVAALVLFGLASEHCRLESMPAFSFLQFCCDEDGKSASTTGCEDDLCGPVESGAYRAEDLSVACPLPAVFLALTLDEALKPLAARPLAAPRQDLAPPELISSWQFSSRAAAPPRAPSFLS